MAVMAQRLVVRNFVVVLIAVYVVNCELAVMLWDKATFLTNVFLMEYPGGFYRTFGYFVLTLTTVKDLTVSFY